MTNLLSNNNSACLGCGQILAARAVINALGPKVIVANATGCLEITTAQWPNTAWDVPWLHSLFHNSPSVASGIYAALKQRGEEKDTKVLVQAGDGATFDIGFNALSGLWNRGEPIIYVVYDNEIYANTGSQSSSATPLAAHTATEPVEGLSLGSISHKKDMLAIAIAHGLRYVAQSTSAHLTDLSAKVKQAALCEGPSYIQVLSSCVPGWGIAVKDTITVAKLAADTGLYPLLEFIDGQETGKFKIPRPQLMVEEYLRPQKRFKHLLGTAEGKKLIKELQVVADTNIKKYAL